MAKPVKKPASKNTYRNLRPKKGKDVEKKGKGGFADPPIATRFKKGISGNPGGRPADSPDLKILKTLTKKELVDVGNIVVKGDLSELRSLARTPGVPVLKVMIAAICVRIIEKGDMNALDVLLNRLIGKVRDDFHLSGDAGVTRPQVIVTLPSNGREAKLDIKEVTP